MTIPVLVLLAAVALAIIGILLIGRSKSPSPDRNTVPGRRSAAARSPAAPEVAAPEIAAPERKRSAGARAELVDKFRGTTLFPQPEACAAAQRLRGKTFEAPEAVRAPVPGCDRAQCQCQVHEVVGRRRGLRRVNADRRADVRFANDRRTGQDRRAGGETWQQAKD